MRFRGNFFVFRNKRCICAVCTHLINLFYIKFSINPYTIDRDYEMQLRNKIEAFRSATKTRSALHLTMITTYGIQRNTHSGIMQSEVTMDDLFVPYEY